MQKSLRLCKSQEFSLIYKLGACVVNAHFILYYRQNPKTEKFRLGVVTSKKVGKAVTRNRMRRIVKAVIFEMRPNILTHMDLVIIVRKKAVGQEHAVIKKSLFQLLKKARLLC